MTRAVSTLGPQGYRDAVAAIDLALAEVKREDEAAGRPYSFDGVSREEVLSLLNQTALADEGATLPDGKPVTVTPEQRELAKKVRRKVRRTVGDDVVLFARGKAVPSTIDAAAFIESALELANSQKWKNQKLFKAALQKMVKAVASKEGIDLTKDSERVNDYISRMVVREVRRALSQSANAVGWYDEKVRKALAVVSLIHPELADDKMAQFAFKWALAVTSNGAKVTDNFKAAERAYRFYKENGRLPIDQGTGTPSEAINEAMELFNDLVAKYGIEDVERFMSTKHTVREIRKYTGVKPGGEYVDTILYGASVVGPKIGNGFFANLYGNFEQLTMDRWFMRTIGRLTGTLIIPKPEVVAKRRTQLRRILAVMSDEQRAELFSTIGVKAPKLKLADAVEGQPAEFAMSNDMTDKIAEAIKKHVTDKATRNVFNTLFPIGDASALLPILGKAKEGTVREAYGNEIRKIANGLWTAKDGQKEIPDGPAERNRLRAIFADALDELRQDYPDLTMADLQAVIWYPEKRLYDASKTKEKSEGLEYEDGAPDYETAAIELAKGLGVSDTAISAATKGIDDDISAKRAAGAGRVSGGTDAGAAVQVQSARDVGERITGDRGGVRAIGATTPLEGAPVVAGATGPDPRIVAVAERYAQANGINLRRQAYYATVDEDRAQRIAAAYDAMPHAPTDPAVVEAYQNLIDQTLAQYRALEEAGYQFYFYDETTDPYDGKPWRALRDLRANQRMAVFATEAGFGTEPLDVSDNPLLADTGLRWAYGTPDGPTRRVLANDLFRAVHDAFGHSMEGAGFRADGEENAWQAHVRLFTGSAVAALTSETRGQNSWLNFGPYGERNRTAAVQDTVFAPQKSGLMPAFTWEEGRVPDMPEPTGPGGGVTPQPSVVSARQPSRGIFDVRNPPVESKSKRGGGAIMAVMDSDGVVYYDVDANMHGDVVDSFPGIEDYIIDGGFIKDGKYIMGTSDGGYSAYEGVPEQIAQVREFTKRVNDPSILSARQPARPLESFTPEFRAWFGDSKVVDEQGRPMVVYHATSNVINERNEVQRMASFGFGTEFREFDEFIPMSHFGTAKAARDRAISRGLLSVEPSWKRPFHHPGSRTYPVYLSIKNPLRVTDAMASDEASMLGALIQLQRERGEYMDIDIDVARSEGAYEAVRRAGYDGLVYENRIEDKGNDSWVIFDPNQAKSIFNERPTQDPRLLAARDPGQRRIDLAYGMGRRSGQQAGVARGRQELLPGLMSAEEQVERLQRAREEVRARRKEDRLRERAKRTALAGRMQARIGRIMAAVEAMRQSADEDADTLMRRALREMLRREAAGSRTGYEFARRELTALKREAADAVRLLPANMRGKYLNRIASVRSAVGVLRISDAVVRDLARYEARSSFNRLRRLERRYASPQTGMTNELRDQILPIVRAGMALLGGQRLMQYTDVNDMSQRIAAANQLAAQARGMYEQERENWRADREMRREGYADAAEALAGNISQMPELPPSRLWSEGRTAGMVGALAIKNSDIHTIAALIDGAIDGPIHDMIHRLSAGKDAMYNDRRRIDQQIDGLLRQAGFTGIDDYVQRGAGYGGTAAADVIDVVLGGTARRITIGEAMSLAAMDDTTLALLADENDPEQPGSPITFSRDGGKLPIPVTQQEVLALRGRLSPGQLALIDGLKGLIDTEIRERSFEVAYRINGRMPEAVPGYYPRRRLSDAIAGDTVDVNANPGNVVMTMLDNAGFLQRRVASTSPLVVDDLVRTIDGHVDEGLRLIHMSEPLRHSITVLRSSGVKDAMESRFGSNFNDQMRKVVFNAVGLSGRPTGDLIDRINGNISGALLMLNPKTWFRQLGGIFRLASEFDTGDWAAGSRRSIALAPSQRTAMIDRIEETSGYFFDRHRRSQVGLFAGVIGDPRQNRERIASMLRSLASNLRSAVDEATQGNIQRMLADLSAGRTNALTILRSVDFALRGIDRQVMLAAYMTARQSLSRTDPSMAEDEAHASACVMAEQAFRRTQNVSDPLDDTVFAAEQKFSKGYGRLLFPFSSDPLKGWNQARRATLNPQNAGRTAFAIGANMLWSAAANPLSLGLAAIGTGLAASEDEDDELLKRALMEKQREGAMRRIANELVASAGGYAGIIAGDIYTAYRAMSDGYAPDQTIQLMPLQVANEVIRSASMGDYGAMAGDLAMMAGIPVTMPIESIARDVEKTIATPDSIRKILLARKQSVGLTPAEEQRLREVQAEIRALKALQTQ